MYGGTSALSARAAAAPVPRAAPLTTSRAAFAACSPSRGAVASSQRGPRLALPSRTMSAPASTSAPAIARARVALPDARAAMKSTHARGSAPCVPRWRRTERSSCASESGSSSTSERDARLAPRIARKSGSCSWLASGRHAIATTSAPAAARAPPRATPPALPPPFAPSLASARSAATASRPRSRARSASARSSDHASAPSSPSPSETSSDASCALEPSGVWKTSASPRVAPASRDAPRRADAAGGSPPS